MIRKQGISYSKPVEDSDEVMQMNSSGSEVQLKTSLQSTQKSISKMHAKSSQVPNKKKKKVITQSQNSGVSTNRAGNIGTSGNLGQGSSETQSHSTLQNYITQNKASQQTVQQQPQIKQKNSLVIQAPLQNIQSNSALTTNTHFQNKKNSHTENINNNTAFNYISGVPQNTINQGFHSLSRGNSMKKMKTFSINTGAKYTANTNMTLNQQQQQSQSNKNQRRETLKPSSDLNNNKNQINLFSTMGNTTVKYQNTSNMQNDEFLNLMLHTSDQPLEIKHEQPQHRTPGHQSKSSCSSNKENFQKNRYSQHRLTSGGNSSSHIASQNIGGGCGGFQQSKFSNMMGSGINGIQSQPRCSDVNVNTNNKLNNLNEIFTDFLDEQSKFMNSGGKRKTASAMVHANGCGQQSKQRAESQHSRQQIIQEEDSLENNQYPKQVQEQTLSNNIQYLDNEGNDLIQDLINKGLTITSEQQRAIKHMAHKSMYSLNTHQVRGTQQNPKSQNQSGYKGSCKSKLKNESSLHNQNQQLTSEGTFNNGIYGTFDNLQYAAILQTQNNNIASQQNKMLFGDLNNQSSVTGTSGLQQNYNFYNIYNQGNRLGGQEALITDINQNNDNEEFEDLVSSDRGFSSGLGRRGGTMQTQIYKRSDSNPNKHKNNRYSDTQDDNLMLEISEDDRIAHQ